MKIFEFQFNPKAQKDRFFRTFTFEPTDESQEEQGSLYIVGELQHALPSSSSLLQKLADLIHKEYIAGAESSQDKKKSFSPTTSLKAALRKANDFLAEESKKGNVDWLGNLHLAILLLVPANAGYTLYFTKVGHMKVWMARNGSLVDAGKSLEREEGEGSSKVFGNVGSGKLMAEDRVAVVTKDLFEAFSKENLLQTISQFKEEKQFKTLFKNKEKALSKVAGVLFFLVMEPVSRQESGEPVEGSSLPSLRIPQVSVPSLPSFSGLKRPNFSLSQFKAPNVSLPAVSVPDRINPKTRWETLRAIPPLKKAVGLVFVLAIILGIGFAIFEGSSFSSDSLDAQAALEAAETLQFRAEQQLAQQNEEEANRLFQEAWQTIVPHANDPQFSTIRQEIETQLQKLNRVEFIGSPELFVTLDASAVPEVPERLLAISGNLYFYHPFSSQIIAVETASKSQAVLSPGRNLKFGDNFNSTFLFFADPNLLISFDEASGWQEQQLAFPDNFRPQGMATFGQSVYFFDGGRGEIAKGSLSQSNVEHWLMANSEKKPLDAASIAIDGNIWVLRNNGEIQRYFTGEYEESINLQVFPKLENPTKIYTRAQLPYLYILDAEHARVLVISKFGDIIRQYQSPDFQEATDFAVPPGGNSMFILKGTQVFRITDIVGES